MIFQAEMLIKSLKQFGNPEITVIITGENKPIISPYLYANSEVLINQNHYKNHPPVRWMVEPRSEHMIFIDADMLCCQNLNKIPLTDKITGVLAHRNPIQWHDLFKKINIPFPNQLYNPLQNKLPNPCPWYVNYGLVIVPKTIFLTIKSGIQDMINFVMIYTNNSYFTGQIALTLCAYKLNVNMGLLPLRYNYPDKIFDPVMNYDTIFPEEMDNTVFYHYLDLKNVINDQLSAISFANKSDGPANYKIPRKIIRELYAT